ncbi:MAG: L,D-transpeptidase family protein [Oligoflexia bacterium]|nr:L,D-transpeptidase family protein [Oligoflexia bacterium]
MRKIKALALVFGILITGIFLGNLSFSEDAKEPPTTAGDDLVVIVDKKANKTYLANYNDGNLDIVNTFRTTLGQAIGDKLMEGDLKTPEGIYEFLFRATAPGLKAMFGPLAIYVSYPNAVDKLGKKTGFDILIHGTDDPARLEKLFDSKGCVVLDNENVKFISDRIKLKSTKVIITQDFDALRNSGRLGKAKAFFQSWLDAWSSKNLDAYIDSYADEFKSDGMNRLAFSKYKDALNKKYGSIKVTASDAHFYLHEKYDLITFTQNYESTFPNGQPAYRGTSKKNLYIQERNGQYKIILEETLK